MEREEEGEGGKNREGYGRDNHGGEVKGGKLEIKIGEGRA